MAFKIRHKNMSGEYEYITLDLPPSAVMYPHGLAATKHHTAGGNIILQRHLYDARERRWIWHNFSDANATYREQWETLQMLTVDYRTKWGLPPTVELWEDGSGVWSDGAGAMYVSYDKEAPDYDKVFIPVKILTAGRTPRPRGGPVIYDESYIEFYLDYASVGRPGTPGAPTTDDPTATTPSLTYSFPTLSSVFSPVGDHSDYVYWIIRDMNHDSITGFTVSTKAPNANWEDATATVYPINPIMIELPKDTESFHYKINVMTGEFPSSRSFYGIYTPYSVT